MDFINSSDDYINHNKKGADLRFAHGETMAPIASLMELEHATTADTDLLHYADVWHADNFMRYSGNIQWVFYKNATGDCLVKILFNECPVHIPVSTDVFPFYHWKDVRQFYVDKLQKLGVGLNDDMYQYLLNLK